jgi:hypothetical protein
MLLYSKNYGILAVIFYFKGILMFKQSIIILIGVYIGGVLSLLCDYVSSGLPMCLNLLKFAMPWPLGLYRIIMGMF